MPITRFIGFSGLLLLVAASAGAQRGGGGGGRSRVQVREVLPPELKTKDLFQLGPSRRLMEHSKELGLTPDQTKLLDSIGKAYESTMRSYGTSLDTLGGQIDHGRRDAMDAALEERERQYRDRPSSAKDSAERAKSDSIKTAKADVKRENLMKARAAFGAVLLEIRSAYDANLTSAQNVLTAAQRAKGDELLQAASEELTQRLHWANARSG